MNLAALCEAKGIDYLGDGGFAAVFANPNHPRTAIKIGHSRHDPWPLWAQFCRRKHLRNNPHVPKVYSCRWVRDILGQRLFYVAEVMRMQPLPHGDPISNLLRSDKSMRKDPRELARALPPWRIALLELLLAARDEFPGSFDMGPRNWLMWNGVAVLNDPISYRANAGSTDHVDF